MASSLPSSDRLFSLLFEEVPCYGSFLDPDLNIIAANRRCRESFATPYSRKCYQVFKSRGSVCDDCPALTTLKGGGMSESEEILTDRSGQGMHVICRTVPVHGDGDRITGVLHLSVRAGQGEKLQQELTTLTSQLRAVSHGIKGLLTAMEGGFYLWDSGLLKNRADRLEEGLKIVRRNYRRLQHLAHGVLYYLRDRRLHPEQLDGVELLRKVAAETGEDGDAAGARITLQDGLPSQLPLEADRRALESALANLVVSSLDDCYTDGRDIRHEVVLSAQEEKGFAVFQVADNGIGMDQDALQKVFSLFFDPKGIEAAGLGLYITNKLARALKGRVALDSEPGKGTRYRLYIPLRQTGGDETECEKERRA